MARMLRNLVGVKPDVQNDDLKRYVGSYESMRNDEADVVVNYSSSNPCWIKVTYFRCRTQCSLYWLITTMPFGCTRCRHV